MFACCTGQKGKDEGEFLPKTTAEASAIDEELELSGQQEKLKFKILLLGSGESGKSTVLKQLKLIHRISLTPQEVKEFASSLKRNSIECMNVLIEQAKQFEYQFETDEQKAMADVLLKVDADTADEITTDVADAIKQLWKSEAIIKTYGRKNEFWILDAAEYYFANVERFVQEDYEPTEEDMVMVCVFHFVLF